MGVHNNQAFLSLSENFRQPDSGKASASQHIPEGKARPHRRQLIRVAYQNQPFARGNGLKQTIKQGHVHHGHFVHNYRVAFQWIFPISGKEHLPRGRVNARFQQPMDGGSVLPGDLRQPLGRPACRRGQQAAELILA